VRTLSRLRAPRASTVVMVVLAALHALWATRLQWDIHRGLGTSSYDVGLYDQGTWLLSRFEAPFVTLMGRNLLGDHASIVMFLVVPFYWFVPGTETLLAIQSVVVASGALPLYFFARRRLGGQVMPVVIGATWLVNPAVNGTNLENFHPDSFLGLFLPLALFAMLEKRWRLYWVAVVLCMTVKEDVSLVLVPLGLVMMLRGERRRGAVTAVAAVAASLAGMFLLMRSLIGVPTRNAWRIPFGGVGGFLRETFTNPGNVLSYLSSEGRLFYLWQMFVPFGPVFLLAPEIAAISVLVLTGNIVSNFWYQFHIGYHYSLVAPGLTAARGHRGRTVLPRLGPDVDGTARCAQRDRPLAGVPSRRGRREGDHQGGAGRRRSGGVPLARAPHGPPGPRVPVPEPVQGGALRHGHQPRGDAGPARGHRRVGRAAAVHGRGHEEGLGGNRR
jgi:uncharacterized membrane protein